MYREREEVPDETEEISLEDTQEYNVAGGVDEEGEPLEEFEEDEFEENEYYEDELEDTEDDSDYYEDDEYVGDTEEVKKAPKQPYEPLGDRIKGVWAAITAQARGVDMPRLPERPSVDTKRFLPVLAIVIASLAIGIGAYAIGKGSGSDVDTARLEGEAAGKQDGAIEGAKRGYAAGFTKGRDAGFEKAYVEQYRIHFKRAFEQAGLEVPADDEFEVPEP